MRHRPDLTPESFEQLLAWLDSDRDAAASAYLDLRHSLVKIFGWNHCSDPDGMADETFDRVARQVERLRQTYEGNPNLFFYGVANNLIREYQKKLKTHVAIDDIDLRDESLREAETDLFDAREQCLSKCLAEFSAEKRDLLLEYYSKEKHAKIVNRAEMARKLGISIQNLRVRMCRLRDALEECIERCLEQSIRGE